MSLIGLILIVVATKVFNLEVTDMQSFFGESSTAVTSSLASIWTSASELVINLPGNIKNLLPQYTLLDGIRTYLVLRAQTGNFGGRQPLTIQIERGMTEPPLPALPKFHTKEHK